MSRKTRRNADPAAAAPPPRAGVPRALLAAAVAIVVALAVALFLGRDQGAAADPARAEALARTDAPTLGDPGARVHVVEFIDPACETCAAFYPRVKQLLATYPGRVRLTMRHVPFHDGADFVVRMLEASRAQDRYWQTLEALLASQPAWAPNHTVQPNLAWQAVGGVGLDLERLRRDMESPEVAARMARDWADAKTVQVTATPEYYVNGRPLPSFGWQQLEDLVKDELRRNY